MARKNRVTVPNGIYHVTSRVCNKAMLFKSPEVKEKIRKWIFDIAYFSGVEIYAWCIMDNHMHLLVHVPRVPERLWTDRSREPESWAFGMRPPECTPPLWTAAKGDSPHNHNLNESEWQQERASDVRADIVLSRPEIGFMLDDEAMIARLARLYSRKAAEEIAARWEKLRANGRAEDVESEKARYCRRMYNISQFVKTLKERIAMRFNAEFDHEGCIWQGRFYSGIVENCREVLAVVAGYIDYNPVKAKLVSSPELWHFSGWSCAMGSDYGAKCCRHMYAKMLGCDWEEARMIMLSVLSDKLPDGVTPEDVKELYDKYDENARGSVNDALGDDTAPSEAELRPSEPCYRASQAICCGMWFFKKGGYIGRTMEFGVMSVMHLPTGFRRSGFKSIKRCRAFVWQLPRAIGPGPECLRIAA